MGEKVLHLSAEERGLLLEDGGYSNSSDPDAYMKRRKLTPPERPTLNITEKTIAPDAATIGKAMLPTTDIGRGHIQ